MSSVGHYKIKFELLKQFNYKCFSMSLQYYKCEYQESNRAIFPPSLLNRLKIENFNREYPMFFELGCNLFDENEVQKKTHVGAVEFIGEEGIALLPEWVLENANIKNGGIGFFKSVFLPRADQLVMVPRELDPTDAEYLKVIMEKKLRNIICLTVSDVIPVRLGSKIIELIVEDVQPGNAVSVINRNINFSYSIPDESYTFKAIDYTRERQTWKKDPKYKGSRWNKCLGIYEYDTEFRPSDEIDEMKQDIAEIDDYPFPDNNFYVLDSHTRRTRFGLRETEDPYNDGPL